MKQLLNTLGRGVFESFKNKKYLVIFVFLFFAFLALFVLIPVWTVPGNSLSTQFGIFKSRDYALFIILSTLSALFITMQAYLIGEKRKFNRVSMATIGKLGFGGFGALFAGIAGTAFCVSCLAPFLALFGIGFGGVVFVLNYRWYFVVAVIIIMLIAIYLTARKINKVCTSC